MTKASCSFPPRCPTEGESQSMPLGADDPGGSHCPGGAGKAGSDPMGADELHERLTGWIETSGRALELRTARTFRGRPFVRYANQSVAYEDPETKQQREGDVVAAYRWITDELAVSVEAAFECKAGKSDPWWPSTTITGRCSRRRRSGSCPGERGPTASRSGS